MPARLPDEPPAPGEGRPALVFLCLPAFMAESAAPALLSLLEQLPGETAVLLAAHRSVENLARAMLERHGGRADSLVLVDDGLPLTLWAQDAFLSGFDEAGHPCLYLDPDRAPKLAPLWREVASSAGLALIERRGIPDGGNVVFGGGEILVGADQWRGEETAALFGPWAGKARPVACRRPVRAAFSRAFAVGAESWQEFHHHGNQPGSRQPLVHLDLFLAPAGRDEAGKARVLVGDPAVGARLAGLGLPPEAAATLFDDVAEQLAEAGTAVHRFPMPLVYADEPEKRERHWYHAPAGNVLLQDVPAKRIVWLPRLGEESWPELAACDAANAALWRGLGFDVRPVARCQALAENYGGLNCLVKVLRRA